jgi:hypothetical protein
VKLPTALLVLCASLAAGCDAVPDLFVVDASVDAAEVGLDATSDTSDAEPADAGDAAPEACTSVSCPACPPNPGMCCASGIPCLGDNCPADCDAGCSSCAGELCCSKQGGQPVCRGDGGKCPP